MKAKAILFLATTAILLSCGNTIHVTISTSESDADIFVNGQLVGKGKVTKIPVKKCIYVRAEKPGYFPENLTICDKERPEPTYKYLVLKKDEISASTIQSDISNNDIQIEVSDKFTEKEAWKIIAQTITSYFDVLESNDIETGYLRTNWVTKTLSNKTIRTRVIIKQGSTKPLKYKVKLSSEISQYPETSAKNDEDFKEWDRILKKYEGIIAELQAKLGTK